MTCQPTRRAFAALTFALGTALAAFGEGTHQVSFGHDAVDAAAVGRDDQRADAVQPQLVGRLCHARVRCDRGHRRTLRRQNSRDSHDRPPGTRFGWLVSIAYPKYVPSSTVCHPSRRTGLWVALRRGVAAAG